MIIIVANATNLLPAIVKNLAAALGALGILLFGDLPISARRTSASVGVGTGAEFKRNPYAPHVGIRESM